MARIKSLEELNRIKERLIGKTSLEPGVSKYRYTILFCAGAGCISSGSEAVSVALIEQIKKRKLNKEIRVVETGCIGACELGPIMVVHPEGILYQRLKPKDMREIVEKHLVKNKLVRRLLYKDPATGKTIPRLSEIDFFKYQQKIVLSNCGIIDPVSIEEYIAHDGYQALSKCLLSMTPEEVIEEVKSSGLKGRGGAGFSTGLKWQFTRQAKGDVKYVVCNADEGDPGAFMDRSLLEGDPYRVIEGMAIAAYAVGAKQGYIYIRAEYPLAIERLGMAISTARKYGLLGEGILGTDFKFDLELRMGAGAFVCGEETALMASVEGKRGTPRPRPPFPAQEGLWKKPTVLNNVETNANIPIVILQGAKYYSSIGTEQSKGTKIYCLAGDINNTGLVEVPIGTEMGRIIYDIGGGIPKGKKFKAIQSGGPSGGCIPREHLNVKVDYESLKALGSIMGSGGLVVMDEDTCMVDIARFFLEFVLDESCGKCPPCREGNKQMLGILNRVIKGEGKEGDIELLEKLCITIKDSALCGLGQTGPNPVLSTINFFRDEYKAHIREQRCPAGVCQALFEAPCQNACPIGQDSHGYIALIAEGRFDEAFDLIKERNPLPAVCGRVCHHPCESKCRRGDIEESIAIHSLKRFVADYAYRKPNISPIKKRSANTNRNKVAIVGSGPAGLTCAYHLARMEHEVTIFESLPVAGGMLAVGIPEYRLPKKILDRDINAIRGLGVKIRTNTPIGKKLTIDDLFQKGYQAVFLGVGAHKSLSLKVPGEDLKGVYQALEFLRDINLGKKVELGKKVAVIGGGNAAIDAVRSALRLGAKEVKILYRRTREEMPAAEEEINDAQTEGVKIEYLTIPVEIMSKEGKVSGVKCQRMALGEFDRSGRRRPIPIEGSEFELDVDTVIPAIGQSVDLSFLGEDNGFDMTKQETFAVDPYTLATNREGVFAGGDAVSGPSTAVEAMAAGMKAAISIDKYLGGEGIIVDRVRKEAKINQIPFGVELEITEKKRAKFPTLSLKKRVGNFRETGLGYNKEMAVEEAKRCLRCDLELEE